MEPAVIQRFRLVAFCLVILYLVVLFHAIVASSLSYDRITRPHRLDPGHRTHRCHPMALPRETCPIPLSSRRSSITTNVPVSHHQPLSPNPPLVGSSASSKATLKSPLENAQTQIVAPVVGLGRGGVVVCHRISFSFVSFHRFLLFRHSLFA
ncbi:hypothetical protein EDB89DRAFT_1972715 [Lactarius sanguifluus]|nr:hypothetical protein EDB89DRAFT_1972715 [Lactarius sanguifluus]